MPHKRKRQVYDLLKKRISSNAMVIVNGARQVGKSFLVREFLSIPFPKLRYVTLDLTENLSYAKNSPSTFLGLKENYPLVVDEAQKAPELFDNVKAKIDIDRRPTQYVFLGSTEFSHKTKIRESLTGRASYVQVYPFNLGETKHLALDETFNVLTKKTSRLSKDDVLIYLERGGLPALFAMRDEDLRMQGQLEWVETTCRRDIFQIKDLQPDPELARAILEMIALEEETSEPFIAKRLKRDLRVIKKHVAALKALFAIYEVPPLPESSGFSQHYLCDVGIAFALGASIEKRLETWLCVELLSQLSYQGKSLTHRLYTYRTKKGSRIPFIVKSKGKPELAMQILLKEALTKRDLYLLQAFSTLFPQSQTIAFAPVSKKIELVKNVPILPWEVIG